MSPQKNGPGDGKEMPVKPGFKAGTTKSSLSKEDVKYIESLPKEMSTATSWGTLIGKKVAPTSAKTKASQTKGIQDLSDDDASYLSKKIGLKTGDNKKAVLRITKAMANASDDLGITSSNQLKERFSEVTKKAGVGEEELDFLQKMHKGDYHQPVFRLMKEGKEDLPKEVKTRGSVGVSEEETKKMNPTKSESKEIVIENRPDSAFKLVKDDKGVVRKVNK